MARCTICEHPARAAIEAELDGALASVDSMSALATKYDLTTGHIRRHPGHPPAAPVASPSGVRRPLAVVPAPNDKTSGLTKKGDKRALEHAREHVHDLQRALETAVDDDRLELQKALTQAIGMQGRLERADAERVSRILRSPEWRRVESALLGALKPFGSKVLKAVGEALAKLDVEDAEPEARAA